MDACIVQVLINMCLLTITFLHNKAAVVTKTFVKSICVNFDSLTTNYGHKQQ